MQFVPDTRSPRASLPRRLAGSLLLLGFAALTQGAVSAQGLPNGGSVRGSISSAGEQDTYTFFANAGEGFQLRLLDVNRGALYPRITLYDPAGAYVTYHDSHTVASISRTAGQTGVYSVVVQDASSRGTETGPYDLHFVRAPGANEGGALTNGGAVNGQIDLGDLDSYTFFARAGEGIQLRITDVDQGAFYPRITLYNPAGSYVTYHDAATVAAIARTAGQTGTYTVIVSDVTSTRTGTGSYALEYTRAPGANEGGALANGAAASGSIGLGDLDSYTFAARAGEGFQLRLADLQQGSLYPRLTLYDPRGAYVTYHDAAHVASISRTASMTGAYTVVVSDATSSRTGTGTYSLEFAGAPGANEGGALLNGGAIQAQLGFGDLDSYTFSASAGEGIQLRITDLAQGALYPRMTLYAPDGAYVTYHDAATVAAISRTVGSTGTYTLIVGDVTSSRTGTGAYSLEFARAPGASEGGFLLDGVAHVGSISLGDLDSFSMLASIGQTAVITLTSAPGSSLYPRVVLYGPSGSYITYADGRGGATITRRIQVAGTYTIMVADVSSARTGTGTYTIDVTGSGNNPGALRNLIGPAEDPNDPVLTDIGGNPAFGPKIGNPAEPINLALDCSGASVASVAAFQMWSWYLLTPLPTPWGFFYARDSLLLSLVVPHNRSVVNWFPAGTGYVIPNDPRLIGVDYTVQGFVAGIGSSGRLSNSITQTIGR